MSGKILIVQNRGGKTHGVLVNRYLSSIYHTAFPAFYTLCKKDWCMDNWKTVNTYKSAATAKRRISCSLCARAMEKKK